jgi:proline dehydrogenase
MNRDHLSVRFQSLHLLDMSSLSPLISFDNTEIAFRHKNDGELRKAAFLFSMMNNNLITKYGTRLTPWAMKVGFPIGGIVKATIFSQFCGGETLDECAITAEKLASHHVNTILDYGVEGEEAESRFDENVQEILRAIATAKSSGHIPFVSMKVTGYARFALLEKVHAKGILSGEEKAEWDRLVRRVAAICKAASESGTGVMIDAEETWIQQPVDDLSMEMMRVYNQQRPVVYNTAQLYRTDRLSFLKEAIAESKRGSFIYAIKLVRGAYMERERRRANDMGYPSPIQPNKEASDRDFNAAVELCFEHIDHVSQCIATHNEYSSLYGTQLAVKKGIAPSHPHLHFSQLFGMSDNITFNLANAGYNVTKYVPYGPVKEVVPYLMRRAKENTSVGGMSSRELGLIRTEVMRRRGSPHR